MKRSAVVGLVIAGVLVVGVGAAVAVSVAGRDDEPVAAETATTAPTPDVEDSEPASEPTADGGEGETETATAGAYVDYSEQALADAEGTRVLFFHASWCPQCHALEDDIEAQGVPDGVTILKVDYDSNQALRQQYEVRQQTTVVALDDSGAAVATFVPYSDPTLATALTGLGLSG
ncbi:hypothetical protein GCM10022200_19510 [Microbacterium awajiense]|uniref:Thioredoxin domain-containing protein n=1 Tax=Microbacterium awajiense TaxID=415214 RepID=A0ABP7ANP4_9MICO